MRRGRNVTLADYLRELALPDLRGEGIDKSLNITLKSLDNAERAVLDVCAACAATGFTVASIARALRQRLTTRTAKAAPASTEAARVFAKAVHALA